MAVLTLPTLTDGTPHYSFRTELEGGDYEFILRYGERRGVWVMDLVSLDGQELLCGQTITVGQDFLTRVTNPAKPPGKLYAMNVAAPEGIGDFDAPGRLDLGPEGRCRLLYTESVE